MKENRLCLNCNEVLLGRKDQKFCDAHCKSAYHYEQLQNNPSSFYKKVDRQLKKNRQLLKSYNKPGKATVRAAILLEQGFNPRYFTHFWKNKKGHIYFFVYEFGFHSVMENGKKKYLLVTWQPYMEKIDT
ncbi:hypothetical protein FHG64_15835 [Antarcticibacterium flavum]|uniref:DUF2116 family Zn-ribbon domain-containing protein n=1 Tax=Antarcticibacterium flavum TaxID=2058175 RepID=A0A5B7X7W9_9FLAO|nr:MULTISPECIES: hypothetical protein [Antarcticibacterium]MCM4161899.1 hypothetical protein [Antarcticibacterium sp. W02-3]QCY70743.1 hypothetical protein FHG64_15835 [Antarcticibacterium flavum]